ncbi:spore protease YyaC [Paenibacillus crassostreae]|uniref:Sporulation protein n=1 Tax=Paenibacillus crassostreae TaxID=1763538 RepID=A0A167BG83_9BACL|nr:spore protease YyaC [Paenibacillus crassostreae]AOZ92866.1 spore protease YyaC [Paenibacillus crassostreae]OAB72044.1 sporulation protein [Paenibacillus crassostreae]
MSSPSNPFSNQQPACLKIPHTDPEIHSALTHRLLFHLSQVKDWQPLIVVCVGTDRSTGDCLGPLVGTALTRYKSHLFHIYGTLEEPVHAVNLQDKLSMIYDSYQQPYIIGIDACLGQSSSIGCIQINEGPLLPGAGVKKQLPPVGDIHITGIVNVGGFMEYFVLQNTRLNLVMQLSDTIALSLYAAIKEWKTPSTFFALRD